MRVLSFSCLCSTYCIVNHLLSTKFKFSCYNALSQYSIDYDTYMIGLVFGDGFSVVEAIDQAVSLFCYNIGCILIIIIFLFVFEITLYAHLLSLSRSQGVSYFTVLFILNFYCL